MSWHQESPGPTAGMKLATAQAAALLVAALAGMPLGAQAHGYLVEPKSRNYIHWSDYCPHCLSAGGPSVVSNGSQLTWPAGVNGLCGDPWNTERKHEAGGVYATGALGGGGWGRTTPPAPTRSPRPPTTSLPPSPDPPDDAALTAPRALHLSQAEA